MLVVVFPGQGSQAIGMSIDFAREHRVAREVLEEADAALQLPLSRWIEEGPDGVLRRTEVTQPAVLAASIAIYRSIERLLPEPPGLLAGHSLGEYTALVAAGALSLAAALRLVRQRGALMQEAVPEGEGAMIAVLGLAGDEVARICESAEGIVAPANFNSPMQTVVAGQSTAVERVGVRCRQAGARRLIPLAVSAPFHCGLMAPAMQKLGPRLEKTCFRTGRVPVVSNVTAEPYRTPEDARRLLRDQVCAPVRWVDCVRYMRHAGSRFQLEVGPGKVLTGLAARINRDLPRAGIQKLEDVEPALAGLRKVLV